LVKYATLADTNEIIENLEKILAKNRAQLERSEEQFTKKNIENENLLNWRKKPITKPIYNIQPTNIDDTPREISEDHEQIEATLLGKYLVIIIY